MARTHKQQSLIQQIEALDHLEYRFENLKCINSSILGKRKGCLSLVFIADDVAEDKKVALKFIDPEYLGDRYRLATFNREPEILKKLQNKHRCLTLILGGNSFNWEISMAGGLTSTLPIDYFVTDWLDEDIEEYFLEQQDYEAAIKLKIFRSAVLAVASFHSEGICHRDLKQDNFRAYRNKNELVAVAIDFGTAAHFNEPKVTTALNYPNASVGAPAFSAPEAIAGLASHRKIGNLTDIYALGALLFNMFNLDLFAKARAKNQHFLPALTFLQAKMARANNEKDKEQIWNDEVGNFRFSLIPPPLDYPGNSVPKSVLTVLSKIQQEMTKFDFRDRITNLQKVITQIDIAIRILNNQRYDQWKLEKRRKMSELRTDKLRRREIKLAEYLTNKKALIRRC